MRHGMTLGELARMANSDLGIGADLTVVPVAGWSPAMDLDQTGLPFVPPSPNLLSLEALFHYPGLCLLEGTNLSVGRGSEHPFEQVGAPWLDTVRVLARLRTADLPGVSFAGVQFRPRAPGDGKYADTLVTGVRLTVTDRSRYDPTVTAVTLLAIVREIHPDQFRWAPGQFDRLAGTNVLRLGLADGDSPGVVTSGWPAGLQAFAARRVPALLYPRPAGTNGADQAAP